MASQDTNVVSITHKDAIAIRLAVLEERVRSSETAMELQAKEYERRLSDLNHSHEKQVSDQQTYMPREVYENFQRESTKARDDIRTSILLLKDELNNKIDLYKEETSKKLILLEGSSSGMGMARTNLFQIVGVVISVLTLGLLALMQFK